MQLETVVATDIQSAPPTWAHVVASNGIFTLSRDELNAIDFTQIPVTLNFHDRVGHVVTSHCDEHGVWRVRVDIEDVPAYERFLEASPHRRVQLTSSIRLELLSSPNDTPAVTIRTKLTELAIVKESLLSGAGWIDSRLRL